MIICEKSFKGERIVFSLSGNLDSLTISEIRPKIETILSEKEVKVSLDLEGLELIDSSGIGVIVSLFNRVKRLGGEMKIVNIKGQPLERLRQLWLDSSLL